MGEILDGIKYILKARMYSLKSMTVYRSQFILWALYSVLNTVFAYVSINVIYDVSSGIPGWSYYQILSLAATSTMFFGIVRIFIHLNNMTRQLVEGDYDIYFARPYSKFEIIAAHSGEITAFGAVLSGFAMFLYSILHLNIGFLSIFGYSILFAIGSLSFLFLFAMVGIALYHIVKGRNTGWLVEQILTKITNYPLSVYGILGQLFFSLFIPIGFAYYYPTELLLHFSLSLFFLVIAGSVIIAVVSYKLFNVLMKTYTSAGG